MISRHIAFPGDINVDSAVEETSGLLLFYSVATTNNKSQTNCQFIHPFSL